MAIKRKKRPQEEILLYEFNRQTKTTKSDLQKIQYAISNGHVPGKEAIDAFHGSLNVLRDKYYDICAMAKDKLPGTVLPPEGSTAQEYVTALGNYKEAELAQLRKKTLAIMHRFNDVLSDETTYERQLRDYKKDAYENIRILEEPERSPDQFTEIEDYEKVLAPAETFLRALSCEDPDSEEGIRLLDKVCEYFSLSIAIGITHNKYYIPENK